MPPTSAVLVPCVFRQPSSLKNKKNIYCFLSMATQTLDSSELPDRFSSTECYVVGMRKVLKLDHCQLSFFHSGQKPYFSFILTITRFPDMREASAETTGLPSALSEASGSSDRWLAQRKLTSTGD